MPICTLDTLPSGFGREGVGWGVCAAGMRNWDATGYGDVHNHAHMGPSA